jgi:hypothetical protein
MIIYSGLFEVIISDLDKERENMLFYEILLIFFDLIIFGFGLWSFLRPESVLKFGDMFRISGDREYTDFAIMMTKLGGIISMIGGIVLIFVVIRLFSV